MQEAISDASMIELDLMLESIDMLAKFGVSKSNSAFVSGLKTTESKAKAIQPIVEKIISLGKKGTFQDKKTVSRFIIDSEIQEKIFGEISVNLKDRTSGFTRITKLGLRKGDTAPMVEISLVDMQEE